MHDTLRLRLCEQRVYSVHVQSTGAALFRTGKGLGCTMRRLSLGDDDMSLDLALDGSMTEPPAALVRRDAQRQSSAARCFLRVRWSALLGRTRRA